MSTKGASDTATMAVRGRFAGGAVVQARRALGDPGDEVDVLQPATIEVRSDRVVAVTGGFDWCWIFDEVENLVHASAGGWTLFRVSGVPDHGVSVGERDVEDFRKLLEKSLGKAAPAPAASSPSTPAASLPAPPPSAAPAGPDPLASYIAEVLSSRAAAPGAGPSLASEPIIKPVNGAGRRVTTPTPASPTTTAQRTTASLDARRVSAWFGDHHVLDDVSLEMPAGEVTALIGPSGCGKSTFLRILNRMHELVPAAAMAGEVLLDGADIYDPQRKVTDARREIGMVFQKPNPFPAMSIYDNVAASLRLTGTKATQAEKDELVEVCLAKAGLWKEVRDRLRQPGASLSGGQQQRLCIARALAIKPRVLLMDEPCSALDPTSTRRIEQTITELCSEVTIVIVTHNMQQASRVSHNCAFFLAEQGTPGVIVEQGPTETIFGSPTDQRTSDYVNGRFG